MATPIPWSAALQAIRARNHSTSSTSPVQYTPIDPAPDVYSHAGRGNNYGIGRRNGRTVRVLIVHETEGGGLDDDRGDFVASMQYEAYRAETTSCTCLIGRTGDVGYDVPEADRPYTTGRWNDESLTIEVDGRGAWTRDQWLASPAQIRSVEDVLVDWCVRFDIPAVWLDAAAVAEGASKQSATPKQGANRGITDHRTANKAAIALGGDPVTYSHTCPGDAFHQLLQDTIIPNVWLRVHGVQPSPPTGEDMTPRNDRILDTRVTGGRFAAGTSRRVTVPYPAASAFIHLVALNASGPGYFVVGGSAKPATSAVNFGGDFAGECGCFTGVDPPGTDGNDGYSFQVWCEVGGADLIVDLQGTG